MFLPAELVERTRELHDYDWSNLETDGVFASYSDDRYTSLQGIDVSEHQAEIDWKKVKEAGIDFAFIRTGYRGTESGRCTEDRWFRTNMEEASAAGIDIGVSLAEVLAAFALSGEDFGEIFLSSEFEILRHIVNWGCGSKDSGLRHYTYVVENLLNLLLD